MDNIFFEDTYTYSSFIFLICTLLVYIFGLCIARNKFPASILIAVLSNSIFVGLVTIVYLLIYYKKEIKDEDLNYIDNFNQRHIIYHILPMIIAFFVALFQKYFVDSESYNLWISIAIILSFFIVYALIPTINTKLKYFKKFESVYKLENKKKYLTLLSPVILIILIILIQQGRIVSKRNS